MSIKLLNRLLCSVCCCLFCVFLAAAANADVCFLPTGECEAASAKLSSGCGGYNLSEAKDEKGWSCSQCGGKWKCDKKLCKDDYKTDVRCSGTETKVCDETRKAGDESCCKCEDSATKCQHEGYVYKKTSTNENCKNKCPYNSDYYESCECNAKYDKASDANKCYTYNVCELGDLAGTKKYEQTNDVHKCKDYMNNAEYVTEDSEQVKGGDYDCALVCTETCDNSNKKYYQCSPKKNCKGGEGMYETEADCKKAYKIASNNSSFERVWAMIMKNITPINQAFAGCPCPTSGPGSGKEYGKDNNGRTLYYSLSPCCQANAIDDSDKIDEALVDGGIKIEDPVYSCKYDEGTKCWYAVVGDADPCANGPYSWRDTECCAKDKWKDTIYCKKPTCTITAGDKKFTDLIYPYQVTDFVPKVCDDRLKEGLGIGNLQYGCYSRNTNYVLGMIRYCGGINDFAGIDDINALAGEMYGRSFTNNAAPGVYERCEISASKVPQYTGFTGSAGASTLYNKIKSHALGRLDDFWINVRECYNGDESGMVNFFFDSYKYGVFHAPVLSSNPYNRGMCLCQDAVDCTGCDYCIAGTCKSSGEKRIISDSSTYEKCADSCGGKYRCKTGYTARYAGSNQYKCVRTSGCYYDTVAQCKAAGYTYTAEERWWVQDEYMTHECESCDCGGTEMNKCVPVGGGCESQYKSQCDSWGGTLKSSTSYVNEDVCHAVYGECDNKYWYCLKPGCSDDGSSGGYETIILQKSGIFPNTGSTIIDNPTISVCGHSYNLNDVEYGPFANFTVTSGTQCEITYSGAWYEDGSCYKQGEIYSDGISIGSPSTTSNGSQAVNGCTCSRSTDSYTYTFTGGLTHYVALMSTTEQCGSGDDSGTTCSGSRPIKFTNIPMTSSSTTCIDVCCGPNADVPSSYSSLGDCNSVGSTYTCPPTTSSILCYRDVQGILHETDGVETGSGITRHCVPGWIQVPHYTRCFGSYLVGCTGG